ncbi:MAG: hypothetical protein QOG38_2820 [Hyphomicrobiales bacterium]|jgi:hypothetical protein|nr:hypothetical protein [Hyphomicrobiales bacterium]
MRELERALADITAIRGQMAGGTQFRGYGPVTIAATGVLTILAAGAHASPSEPWADLAGYLTLWVVVALVSAIMIGKMVARTCRHHSGLADEMLHTAVEQFMPAAVAEALLTVVLARSAPQSVWMLPGLWQIIFGFGVFASCRTLPRPMFAAGAWYLAAGLVNLAFANADDALSPWSMAIPYGIGQLSIAVVLHRSVGAHDDDD